MGLLVAANKPLWWVILIVVEATHMWNWRYVSISVPSTQFDCEPKITLNNRVY